MRNTSLWRRLLSSMLILLTVWAGVGVAFPSDPNDVTVEIFYDGVWNDITTDVFDRNGTAGVTITRGRANEGVRCDPGRASMQINNSTGKYSPRNPVSPLYGKIGRNTKLRVKVTYSAVTYVRFVGEVSAWPTYWDLSENDVWVPIEAAGILRRLGQAATPLRSPLFRTLTGVSGGNGVPHAYWPLEDGSGSTQAASGLPGGTPMSVSGAVSFAADSGLLGSQPLPTLSAGQRMDVAIPTYTDVGQWVVQFAIKVDTEPAATADYLELFTPGGSIASWRIQIVPGSPALVRIQGYNADGSIATGYGINSSLDGLLQRPTEAAFFGTWQIFSVTSYQLGANVMGGMAFTDDEEHEVTAHSGGSSGTHGALAAISVLGGEGASIGHVTVLTDLDTSTDFLKITNADTTLLNVSPAIRGWTGEEVDVRLQRLCDEENISLSIAGTTTARMGPQRSVTLLENLEDCAAVDRGFLFEQREAVGLAYRTNASRYNQ